MNILKRIEKIQELQYRQESLDTEMYETKRVISGRIKELAGTKNSIDKNYSFFDISRLYLEDFSISDEVVYVELTYSDGDILYVNFPTAWLYEDSAINEYQLKKQEEQRANSIFYKEEKIKSLEKEIERLKNEGNS